MKWISQFLKKIQLLIKNYGSKFTLSIGIGGVLALYIIEICRIKLIPILNRKEALYKFFVDNNITEINKFEICILIISIAAIIASPLLSKKDLKRDYEVLAFIILFIFELASFMSIIVYKDITEVFILVTTIMSFYLVWIGIDILKIIYGWSKIDRSAEKQVDVAKLTFIWAVIAFILGALR